MTVKNRIEADLSAAGDLFLIGGVLSAAKAVLSGLINIRVMATGEAAVQGASALVGGYNAYNAETKGEVGLRLIGAAANILIARGAIKLMSGSRCCSKNISRQFHHRQRSRRNPKYR